MDPYIFLVHVRPDDLNAVAAASQIFGHLTRDDDIDAGLIQRYVELGQLEGIVELGAVRGTTGTREDGSNRVGGGLAHLVLAAVPRDGAVRRLRLDHLVIGAHQHRGHQTQRAVPSLWRLAVAL